MKDRIVKQVFVTKYALTEGIFQMRAEIVDNKYASAKGLWIGPNDWHETKESALRRVDELITAKRKSMAKIEAKLAKMSRSIADGSFEIETR